MLCRKEVKSAIQIRRENQYPCQSYVTTKVLLAKVVRPDLSLGVSFGSNTHVAGDMHQRASEIVGGFMEDFMVKG